MRILPMIAILAACQLAQAAPAANAAPKTREKPAYSGPVKAQEVRVRDGAGHFLAKLKAGKTVTVAYLGGSITAMSGWRNMTSDWLRSANTNASSHSCSYSHSNPESNQ